MIPSPKSVYRRLLDAYGPQGWWPTTPRKGRAPAYRPGFRGDLSERERAEICVGAVLTQNANWGNVQKALGNLHREDIWDLESLRAIRSARLEKLIRPSGYFRQKARKLKAFAAAALRSGGNLARWLEGPLDHRREELLGIWGVGPETADSILLYAGRREIFVVDAYTLRIGRRLGWFKPGVSYREAQALLTNNMARSRHDYAELHALLVVLAKNHCRTKPLCAGCPLSRMCRYNRRGSGMRGEG